MTQILPSLNELINKMPAKYQVKERSWLDEIHFAMVALACTLLIPIALIDKVSVHISAPLLLIIMYVAYLINCWQHDKKEYDLIITWIKEQKLPDEHTHQLCNELEGPASGLLSATGRFIFYFIVSGLLLAVLFALTGDNKSNNKSW